MNGPQHYAAAVNCWKRVSGDAPEDMAFLAEGQLHATLALAAAQVFTALTIEAASDIEMHASAAWAEVTS